MTSSELTEESGLTSEHNMGVSSKGRSTTMTNYDEL